MKDCGGVSPGYRDVSGRCRDTLDVGPGLQDGTPILYVAWHWSELALASLQHLHCYISDTMAEQGQGTLAEAGVLGTPPRSF